MCGLTANGEAALVGGNVGKVGEQSGETITALLGSGKVGAGHVPVGRRQLVKSVEYPSCGDIPTALSSRGAGPPAELE